MKTTEQTNLPTNLHDTGDVDVEVFYNEEFQSAELEDK